MKEVKAIDLLKEATLLPPKPDVCQKCAVDHPPHYPHNQQSLYWQYWFKKNYERWPTWKDAMSHCDEEVKALWVEELGKKGRTV